MPDLFLFASQEDAKILSMYIEMIGPVLRSATASAIPDLKSDPGKVAVYIIAHQGGDNIPPLQIVGMASWSEEREKHIDSWKKALASAWNTLIQTHGLSPYKDKFPVDEVEIWPTMPKGSWGLAGQIWR